MIALSAASQQDQVIQKSLPDTIKQIFIALSRSTEVFNRENFEYFPVLLCDRSGFFFYPLKQNTSPLQKKKLTH